jgi:hypothetical protein
MDEKSALDQMAELLSRIEPLNPKLAPFLNEYDPLPGMKVLHHPLVISLPHSEFQNAWINKQFEHKTQALEKAIADQDWSSYIFLHERPYRIDALYTLVFDLAPEEPALWKLIGQAWCDSENIYQCQGEWVDIWSMDTPGREAAMDDEERTALADMADTFTVYRGMGHEEAVEGMSWTTDKTVATKFAKRFTHGDRHPYLATGKIRKSDVLAYFTGRNESEIVVMWEDVTDIVVKKL